MYHMNRTQVMLVQTKWCQFRQNEITLVSAIAHLGLHFCTWAVRPATSVVIWSLCNWPCSGSGKEHHLYRIFSKAETLRASMNWFFCCIHCIVCPRYKVIVLPLRCKILSAYLASRVYKWNQMDPFWSIWVHVIPFIYTELNCHWGFYCVCKVTSASQWNNSLYPVAVASLRVWSSATGKQDSLFLLTLIT